MREVFADACYWVAMIHPKDELHDAAIQAKDNLGNCVLLTTDEVLTEFLTLMGTRGQMFRRNAAETVRTLMNNPNIRILPQTRDSFIQAMKRYEQNQDKKYSLVDCASMNAMDNANITEVLTHDHHFKQAGYTILM